MTGVSVERVYDAAMKQLAGLSRLSAQRGPSGLIGEVQTDQKDQIDKIDQTDILAGYTVFFDRDGTLNPDPGYIRSPDQFELFPGVAQAMAKLKQAGARLIVVTNQSGVARGFVSSADLDAIHAKLGHLLGEAGASLDAIHVCPHHPDDACECRKPNMIELCVNGRWTSQTPI